MRKCTPILWFSLIETIITVAIMAILIWIVFKTYVVIGRIAVFIKWERWIHNEIIYLTQVIQNLVDNQSVVMTWTDFAQLTLTNGYKEDLELVDDNFYYTFTRTCVTDWCYVNLEKKSLDYNPSNPDDILLNTALTNTSDIEINQFVIKVLPFREETTFTWTMHDWFWLSIDAESAIYSETNWWHHINYQWQLFFNPRKY